MELKEEILKEVKEKTSAEVKELRLELTNLKKEFEQYKNNEINSKLDAIVIETRKISDSVSLLQGQFLF